MIRPFFSDSIINKFEKKNEKRQDSKQRNIIETLNCFSYVSVSFCYREKLLFSSFNRQIFELTATYR